MCAVVAMYFFLHTRTPFIPYLNFNLNKMLDYGPKSSGTMSSKHTLSTRERTAVVRCLVDGYSMRATSRILNVARNTIDKLLVELGAACSAYQDRTLRNLTCRRLQVDEI